MKKILSLGLTSLLAISFLSSCNKTADSSTNGQTPLSLYLTDDPGMYDKVNIDIQSVQIKYSDDQGDAGWEAVHLTRAGVFNLLDFRNGYDTLLAKQTVTSGRISQIRLILGPNNSVVYNGVTYPLVTPSAQQSGLKLNVQSDLVSDIDYRLWLDFDAGKSIVQTGNGKYILKPVIRTYVDAISGGITGMINPLNSTGFVYALRSTTDTVASAIPSATGSFTFRGLSAGSYSLNFDGMNGYRDTTLNNINVVVGAVTNAGTLVLHQ